MPRKICPTSMFTYTCLNEECEADVEIEIEMSDPGYPEVRASFSDPGSPKEWPEITILSDTRCEKCGHNPTEQELLDLYYNKMLEKFTD